MLQFLSSRSDENYSQVHSALRVLENRITSPSSANSGSQEPKQVSQSQTVVQDLDIGWLNVVNLPVPSRRKGVPQSVLHMRRYLGL
jgi:hypothetical protein